MMSSSKIIGVISCSVVLGLSLSNAVQARMSSDPCADRKGGLPNLVKCDEETRQGIKTIKGEVLRADDDTLLIGGFNGQQIWVHVDQTTKMIGHIGRGDRIEAKVDEVDYQQHVLSLHRLE